jgi:hypothetical protein
MRKGNTSFGVCEMRFWRHFFLAIKYQSLYWTRLAALACKSRCSRWQREQGLWGRSSPFCSGQSTNKPDTSDLRDCVCKQGTYVKQLGSLQDMNVSRSFPFRRQPSRRQLELFVNSSPRLWQVNTPFIGPFFKGGICTTLGWAVAWPFETVRNLNSEP